MKEQLITFETAKLAKEKGFDSEVYSYYTKKQRLFNTLEPTYDDGRKMPQGHMVSSMNYNEDDTFSAPTESLLKKWLREVHGIYVNSEHDLNPKGDGILYHTNWGFINASTSESRNTWYRVGGGYSENEEFKTYEQALEAGLQEALKLI